MGAPHEQHGAADADQVERRVRELGRELAAGLEQRGDVRARLAVAAERVDDRALRVARSGGELPVARSRCARRTSSPGTGTGIESSRRTIGSSSIGSNQDGTSSPSGATGTTPASSQLARVLGQPQRDAAAERGARDTTGSPPAQRSTSSAANASSCGSTAPGASAGRLAEAGQVDRDRAPPARGELGQQRAPGVGRVAPAVQQDDAGAVAVHLERARAHGLRSRSRCSMTEVMSRGIPPHRQSMTRCQPRQLCWTSERRGRGREPLRPPRSLGAVARRPAAGARTSWPSRPPSTTVRRPPRGPSGAATYGHAPDDARRDGAPTSCDLAPARRRRDRRRRVHHDRAGPRRRSRGSQSRHGVLHRARRTAGTRATRCGRPSCWP